MHNFSALVVLWCKAVGLLMKGIKMEKTAKEITKSFEEACNEIGTSKVSDADKIAMLNQTLETTKVFALLNVASSLEKIAEHLDEILGQGVEI